MIKFSLIQKVQRDSIEEIDIKYTMRRFPWIKEFNFPDFTVGIIYTFTIVMNEMTYFLNHGN